MSMKPQHQRTRDTIEALAAAFPAAFTVVERSCKPMKVRIRDDIIERCPTLTKTQINRALKAYTSSVGYVSAVSRGEARVDLDGRPCGVVSPDEAEQARQKIEQLKMRKRQKPPPATKPAAAKGDGIAALKEAARKRRQGAA